MHYKQKTILYTIKHFTLAFFMLGACFFSYAQQTTKVDSLATTQVQQTASVVQDSIVVKVKEMEKAVLVVKDSAVAQTKQVVQDALVEKDSTNTVATKTEELAVMAKDSIRALPKENIETVTKPIAPKSRKLVDGVVGVVGDFIILNSDIDKAYIDLKNQGVSTSDVSRCEVMGSLLENKLYNHHAIQDSIPVSDKQVQAQVDQQFDYMRQQIGDEEKILEFYRKDNIQDFKKELFDLGKSQRLSQAMQQSVIEEITITPDEVKQFFDAIPKEERPVINTEVEISQIVIKPKPSVDEVKRVEERLAGFRKDVLENGASFATKAVLYSQDPGSRSNGGKYTISRKDPFAKEFKEAAFSLQEGEVSKPFKTDFGYHIVTVDKIKGQKVDVRHILLIPEVGTSELIKFKESANAIRNKIVNGEITFEEAAKTYSDEKETKSDGGILINPVTTDRRFELTKIDPILYGQVSNLEQGDVSAVIPEQERTGGTFFKIMKVTKKYPEHIADFANDYTKIKDLALNKKQLEAVDNWQKEKIVDTYIKINEEYQSCEFSNNWLKK